MCLFLSFVRNYKLFIKKIIRLNLVDTVAVFIVIGYFLRYFTEALNSMMLPSECNEIQLNKDGTWCVQQPEKKVVNKVEKAPVAAIAIDDSIEIIGDDVGKCSCKIFILFINY